MSDYIGGNPPAAWLMSVTRGADKKFTLRRRNAAGETSDWNAQVYLNIQLDPVVKVNASVEGSEAVFRIESTIVDRVLDGTEWQAIMSTAGNPSFENTIVVGKFKRHDG